ncbi:YhcN/YlaJ family sporulation lipoprotein [Bacillus sp. EB600]|uniref:YhcN/YlaJ family sporulation lipoprotein n=1 Tax=Bacillus sp. EB600 TaxID=2806345 RepID=UPI002108BD3B|nr:YhcN/YlaJ family sporulation lipoprotein [Bacillus sp. EB600]MCQ6277747.1 YhcN/YlaJ family sporulation lipoprotein [Bacillus sp. EB600]
MKLKLFMIGSILLSIGIAGCARNNVNDDNVAYRNKNGMQPTRVDYPNRPGVRDVNDTNLNRTDLRDNNGNVVRNDNGIVNNDNDGRSRMRIADQAANKVADMREVDSANIIVTDNNAYAAVKLANGEKLTNGLEKRISSKVKSVDRDIDRVFVSANPDFYNHMRGYANDIRAGKPVSGFFTEFSQTVRRVFPDVK